MHASKTSKNYSLINDRISQRRLLVKMASASMMKLSDRMTSFICYSGINNIPVQETLNLRLFTFQSWATIYSD